MHPAPSTAKIDMKNAISNGHASNYDSESLDRSYSCPGAGLDRHHRNRSDNLYSLRVHKLRGSARRTGHRGWAGPGGAVSVPQRHDGGWRRQCVCGRWIRDPTGFAGGVVITLAGSVSLAGAVDATNSTARFGSTFFGGPRGVAVDGATNIYVADTYNSAIRRVSPAGTNWVVTTFAGALGLYGFADGTNASAGFANPYGIARDNAGIIYVTDSPAQTIRKIVVLRAATTETISVRRANARHPRA
jgi:hypothetical protein